MKIKYTAGENGLNGKTHNVEIVSIEIVKAKHIDLPLLSQIKIKYENGKTEWIDGNKLFHSIDSRTKRVTTKIS